MKIYVAYTGGTIGMVPSDQGYVPGKAFAADILRHLNDYQPEHGFDVYSYKRLIDSSNATPEDWQTIAEDLQSKWHDYDAFIVLHGTDTMAYSAAALAFMFQHSRKPIVVTGSQIPMIKKRNDALSNVFGAVDAVLNGPNGVFLFFGGKLLEATRARKIDTSALSAFQSPNFLPRGVLGIEWEWRKMHLPKQPECFQIPPMASGHVTILPVFPGVQATHWEGLLNKPVKGAVLYSYGTGNAPDQDANLLNLLQEANDRGVVIVKVSQCGKGAVSSGTYAVGSALERVGVISGRDMTFEAAFTKLHFLIALGLPALEIKNTFSKTLAFDIL
ncbi:asparaginase domain-containing protein [Marinomonas sp. 2405UD68-3]|uniref:asparaginase domain-containing protein n=1 Tax=Marinomonas sp. 2405UD68-3 TaxID=3391835 RepID=UPI0039C94452